MLKQNTSNVPGLPAQYSVVNVSLDGSLEGHKRAQGHESTVSVPPPPVNTKTSNEFNCSS